MAFVKNIVDRLLMYNTAAITTHFLYYTLIDTGNTQWFVILGFDVMRRFVAFVSRLSD